MNTISKYIIYFIFGIIFNLLFNDNRLVEGLWCGASYAWEDVDIYERHNDRDIRFEGDISGAATCNKAFDYFTSVTEGITNTPKIIYGSLGFQTIFGKLPPETVVEKNEYCKNTPILDDNWGNWEFLKNCCTEHNNSKIVDNKCEPCPFGYISSDDGTLCVPTKCTTESSRFIPNSDMRRGGSTQDPVSHGIKINNMVNKEYGYVLPVECNDHNNYAYRVFPTDTGYCSSTDADASRSTSNPDNDGNPNVDVCKEFITPQTCPEDLGCIFTLNGADTPYEGNVMCREDGKFSKLQCVKEEDVIECNEYNESLCDENKILKDSGIFKTGNSFSEICCQYPTCENSGKITSEQCSELNKTLLSNKKCDTTEKCSSISYCCSLDAPESIKDMFNEIYFTDETDETDETSDFESKYTTFSESIKLFEDPPTQENLDSFELKPGVIPSIQRNFGNESLFTENWIGEGGGQEEMANDVWKRLINRFNNIKGNNDLNDLTNMTEDDFKIMLINLDKPIKDEDGELTYPISGTHLQGLSPIDIFLYNQWEGDDTSINAAQLEALL